MNNATMFGTSLSNVWTLHSAKVKFFEVHLFRALMDCFTSLKNRFHIEEYHGSRHQVTFLGTGKFSRPKARCELSDLLIVTYGLAPDFWARMTFLQAKRCPSTFCLCGQYPSFPESATFKGNSEQWDLLSRRPCIEGVSTFKPPPHLLKGAILPSVGSFGIFHRTQQSSIGFMYVSADRLSPKGNPTTSRQISLVAAPGMSIRIIDGFPEATLLCCIEKFGTYLFEGCIGSPISYENVKDQNDLQYRSEIRRWLGAILAAHAARSELKTPVVDELLLGVDINPEKTSITNTLPSVLVIRTDITKE
ncbi:MAG: hypothetical protein HQK57_02880 [Deltaproteobacteria bacterium]|nr:hypothetical protein [Deltaproteobacteria bacterium]